MAKAPLNIEEKRVIKALLNKKERNQDILNLINTNRVSPVNGGRITGVKNDANQAAASDAEVALFRLKKVSYDPKTGLNQYGDERLIRSREAMILAVQVFNSPAVKFKTEVFAVLSNIAWTYLLHEHYDRQGVPLVDDRGKSLVLSQMLNREDCPLSAPIKKNLLDLKEIRDQVEHLILGTADLRWSGLFQANCLNFDKTIRALFGEKLTLSNDLSLALQFAKPSIDQLSSLMTYDVPADIAALDARLQDGVSENILNDIEYQFRVVYTLDASARSHAHFHFVKPDSEDGQKIHNVLARKVASDEDYPLRVKDVIDQVKDRSGQAFNRTDHQKAWKLFRVRPNSGAAQPENTDKRYCIYHRVHKDYTYSPEWVDRLVEEVSDPEKLAQIRGSKQ